MAAFERLLTSPTPEQFLLTLVEATAAANLGLPLLPMDRMHWEEFLAEMGHRPEGARQWSDTRRGHTARVFVAWWNDHVGRRHVRVLGGNSRDGSYRALLPLRNDPRPPLFHVYPDRVFCCQRDGGTSWLVVCACGVAGPPGSIGWMGRRCGPCHDRMQEGNPGPELALTSAFTHQANSVWSVTFSRDGRYLTSGVSHGSRGWAVRVHDLAEGTHHDLPPHPGVPLVVAMSACNRFVALTDGLDQLYIHEREGEDIVLHYQGESTIQLLAFSPEQDTLVVAGNEVRLWQDRGHGWQRGPGLVRIANALCFSPHGDRLAISGPGYFGVWNVIGSDLVPIWEARLDQRHTILDLVYLPEEILVLTEAARPVPPDSVFWPIHVRRYTLNGELCSVLDLETMNAHGVFARNGLHVFMGHPFEPFVAVMEVTSGRLIGRIAWNFDAHSVQFVASPDGQHLALVHQHSIEGKLIPWRLLLG